eukprot:TRINITY_DN27620_c0_g1_i1.p1 TRINITY_DN27620_c0_g1~~TRINITY_DN27620_c0_g1_i1.p1  ORF type:complete len:575 (+),score=107.44 TRINITY_DN27620_c0_g1_i1:276-2000(+)
MVSRKSLLSFLAEYLEATNVEVDARALSLHSFEVECAELCSKTVQSFPAAQRPPTSDVACYMPAGTSVPKCDLDVSEEALKSITFGDHNPFAPGAGSQYLEGSNMTVHKYTDSETVQETKALEHLLQHQDKINSTSELNALADMSYPETEPQQIAIMIANLFRVYPLAKVKAVDRKAEAWERGAFEALLLEADGDDSWKDTVVKVAVQAQAYTGTALRNLNTPKGARQMTRWFGRDDEASKREVRRVLNSVHNLLSNVDYVYPGSNCKQNTFAYVYPNPPLNKNKNGQFVFHLCKHYMEVSLSEQIETLTHEASHHRMSLTKDQCYRGTGKDCKKAYGRLACQMLARSAPEKALHNADNVCYFVNDAQPGDHEPSCPTSPKCSLDSSCVCTAGYSKRVAETAAGAECHTCERAAIQCPHLPKCRKMSTCFCEEGMKKTAIKATDGSTCYGCRIENTRRRRSKSSESDEKKMCFSTNTGGTCKWWWCSTSRGPTECENGMCMCKIGFCAEGGSCTYPSVATLGADSDGCHSTDTGGTCRFWWCDKRRGPTDCKKAKCMCKPGYCAVDGICKKALR